MKRKRYHSPRELATRRPHGGAAVLSSSRPNLVMYLKTSLLILLLLAPVQKKPQEPVCAVAGEWRLDKVRSPYERADTLVWRIRITKARVVWNMQSTKDGEMTPTEYIYKVGHARGRSKDGRRWKQYVEFDETRLRVWTREFERLDVVAKWSLLEFEVKDHGYTLYYRYTWGVDVTTYNRILYFRPLGKKKK